MPSMTLTVTWSSSAECEPSSVCVPAVPAISGVSSFVTAGGAVSDGSGATVSRSVVSSATTVTASAIWIASRLPALSTAIV